MAVQLTRNIYRDDKAFGIYNALYCNRHPDREIDTLFSVGDPQNLSGNHDRVAFHCRIRAIGDAYQVMIDDAAESAWAEEVAGVVKLTRAQALEHPSKAEVFQALDEAMLHDPSLHGYLQRCHCGDPAVPLEPSYDAPDAVLELPPDVRESRAKINRSFTVLDEQRYFIRCLIPFSIENYGRWAPSIWVEVSEDENRKVTDAWEAPESYEQLRFEAEAANDLSQWGIDLASGTKLTLATENIKESPNVVSVADEKIKTLMSNAWSQADFEAFAVKRGIL